MAKLNIYSVYDMKVKAYAQPFFCRSRGEALRSFGDACNEKDSNLFKHAEDFVLFELGEFDDATGEITKQAPQNLGLAAMFRSTENPKPLSRNPVIDIAQSQMTN